MCLDRPRDPLPTRVELCPPLPTEYAAALDAGLAALGLELTPGARVAIDGHVRLLIAWNVAINLTAIREPAAIAIRHVVDSLTGLTVLRERSIDRFVDLGSGGGFPGLTLAAARPADRALLIDSIAKKVRFLTTTIEAVGLSARVAAEPVRAESLAAGRDRGAWPAVTARAVGPLAELIELGLPLLGPRGVLVAWKAGNPEDPDGLGGELATAGRALGRIDPGAAIIVRPVVAAARQPVVADLADHRLVIVERSRDSITETWPRDPAARRRSAW